MARSSPTSNFSQSSNKSCHFIAIGIKLKELLRIMQGLRSLCSKMQLMSALFCANNRPSAVCQQKFTITYMLMYLHGLSAFQLSLFNELHSALFLPLISNFRHRSEKNYIIFWPVLLRIKQAGIYFRICRRNLYRLHFHQWRGQAILNAMYGVDRYTSKLLLIQDELNNTKSTILTTVARTLLDQAPNIKNSDAAGRRTLMKIKLLSIVWQLWLLVPKLMSSLKSVLH